MTYFMKIFQESKWATVDRRAHTDAHIGYTAWRLLIPYTYFLSFRRESRLKILGGSNMTGTDLCVNKPHCAATVRPSEATTSTLPPARVRTCSVLSGSC